MLQCCIHMTKLPDLLIIFTFQKIYCMSALKMIPFMFILLFGLQNTNLVGQNYWSPVEEKNINIENRSAREIIPEKYNTFSLSLPEASNALRNVLPAYNDDIEQSDSRFWLPMPDGSMVPFVVWEASVMEQPLADKYPSIRSYKGYQANNKNVTARFTVGPLGFHAAIRTEEGMAYIDPYVPGETKHYQVYYTADHKDAVLSHPQLCGTSDETMVRDGVASTRGGYRQRDFRELRRYRLALACTGEWGAVRGTKEKALAEMVTFVERANIVFEAEIAATAVLIASNDQLIFLDGITDPYTNPNQGLSILGQNTAILNGRIGGANYEIGHVFSICFDVGGVAGGNICTPGKGAGVTCHNGNSVTTGIVLVFNHEVGHQMTASHTFNKCGDTDQLALGTAYEPGSGSTIMAYPGACGSDNLGAPRDDYYHVASLEQMLSFTDSDGADAYECAEKVDIGNHVPVIDMPYTDGFSIPFSTPFFLKASATDEDGDAMRYTWEQFDNQTSSPLGSPTGNAPIFRSLKPNTNPARYFPNVSRILSGQFSDKSELLPTYGRDLTFRFVVRDNHPMGNAAVWEELKFKVAGNAGPFKMTFPILDYKWKIGEKVKVTWDVANTDKAPVNCSKVDIFMAFNNSLDFDSDNLVPLLLSTPNDGEAEIIVPNRESIRARIVVKASNNIFFTTNTFNSRIDAPLNPTFFMDADQSFQEVCAPETATFGFSTTGLSGFSDSIRFEVVSGIPEGAVASFSNPDPLPGDKTTLQLDLSNVSATADYEIRVRAFVPGLDTIERIIFLGVTSTRLDYVQSFAPANGSNGVGPTQRYVWEKRKDATSYELEVATSPAFKSKDIVISRIVQDTQFASNTFLDKATIYYWRVRASNACRDGAWSETFAFNTEALNCNVIKSGDLSINISATGLPVVEAQLPVLVDAVISDVNVKNIRGEHSWSSDLEVYLAAPSGKEIALWKRRCSSANGFNLGLDDQSNDFFQCPISTSRIYRPENKLSAFNGESAKGNWTLRIEDKASGNGGKLRNFDLEICANITLDPPVLTRNEILYMYPGEVRDISRDLLRAEDNNNGAAELQYTLVQKPSFGVLTINNLPMSEGSTFTQKDIDEGKLSYIHGFEEEKDDAFTFVVADGQGGWISITRFTIDTDLAAPSSAQDEFAEDRILVYPNPTHGEVSVMHADYTPYNGSLQIMDVRGTLISEFIVTGDRPSVDISQLRAGIYVFILNENGKRFYKKLVKW
jgi:subtilisin-like proprotein convertase family protein